jgi:folate-dependent phosphoribosylglycinamide formyltransferase PurN
MTERIDDLYEACDFPGERRPEDVGQLMTLGFLEGRLSATPTDVAVISDRGPLNLESLMGYAGRSGSLAVRGVILPGSELDSDMTRLIVDEWVMAAAYDDETSMMERLRGLDEDGNPIDRGDFIIKQPHPITGKDAELFRLAHESYDAAKLHQDGRQGALYRRRFGSRLIRQLNNMDPSVIFLDNFKVILPQTVVEDFAGKFVNVHPSVLPLSKGYRPERRALDGENPEANGYTMHVVNEDLDGGATLLQQRVPILPADEAMRAEMGKEAYAEWREEQSRLRIMMAQSPFVPWVLHIYNSDLERRVVEGPEAFAAEGRPGFEDTPGYKEAMAEEPDTAYQRILFENPLAGAGDGQPEFITLEEMLAVPPEAVIPAEVSGIHRYDFTVPVLTDDPEMTTYTGIEMLVGDLNSAGFGASLETGQILPHRAEVSLRTMVDCRAILANMGVAFEDGQQKVHVRTPRRPVAADRLAT